jgi:hypothetical protein
MGDSRLIEQPVGHEHPLAATIHCVVVRGGHDPDPHRLQIVDDGLGAARLGAVVVRARLVDNRTFHVGVSRVRGAHHFGQSLEPRIARLTHRVTDDNVPDRSEGEGLGFFIASSLAGSRRACGSATSPSAAPYPQEKLTHVTARTAATNPVATSF